VYTVGELAEPVQSQGFLTVKPQYTIADCPKPDIVVIPGGHTNILLRSPTFMAWIGARAKDTDILFSVCTGAFVLAHAGLLDGLEATTHESSISGLKEFPRIKVRENRRVVDNGKIVTTAGVSAGIDGALHLVARLCGRETAKQTATFMQYRWEPEAEPPAASEPLNGEESAAHSWFAGHWSEAEKAYQGIVARQPTDGVALYRLGVCQFRGGSYEAAVKSFEQAVRYGHQRGDVLALLGVIQFRLKRIAAAGETFERALKRGHQEAFIYYLLARIYAMTGAKDKALAALEQAFERGIDNAGPALLEPDLGNIRAEKRFREVFRKYSYGAEVILVTKKEPGDSLVVTGVVRDADGKPVPGAVVFVYHTDARGYYSAKDAGEPRNPRLFAYLRTAGDGAYEFRTIRPGHAPDSRIPQQIHVELTAPGYRNYVGELLFDDDPRLKGEERTGTERNRPVMTVARDKDGVQRCTVDLTLSR
jgi:putative intracellular protease/amidase